MMLIALFAAYAEQDGYPSIEVHFSTPTGYRWSLLDQILRRDDVPIVDQVHGEPAWAGDRVVVTRIYKEPVHTELVLIDGSATPRILPTAGDPTRVALSSDGTTLAWVSGHTGWASVWVQPIDGLPRQLTNTDLVRRKGQAPLGFIAPPLEAPRFEGDLLIWATPSGPVQMPWRL